MNIQYMYTVPVPPVGGGGGGGGEEVHSYFLIKQN